MKKIFLTMIVLALAIFAMASCDNTEEPTNNKKKCSHPADSIVEVAAKAATCTEDGYTKGKVCKKCGKTTEGMIPIAAVNHRGTTVSIPAVEATCDKAGLTEGSRCEACLAFVVKQTVIPKLQHNEVPNDDVPATETEPGSTGGTHCSICFNEIQPATQSNPTGQN